MTKILTVWRLLEGRLVETMAEGNNSEAVMSQAGGCEGIVITAADMDLVRQASWVAVRESHRCCAVDTTHLEWKRGWLQAEGRLMRRHERGRGRGSWNSGSKDIILTNEA